MSTTPTVLLSPRRPVRLPRGCKTILDVSDRGADGRLTDSAGDIQTIPLLDRAPLPVAEEAAAALAPDDHAESQRLRRCRSMCRSSTCWRRSRIGTATR